MSSSKSRYDDQFVPQAGSLQPTHIHEPHHALISVEPLQQKDMQPSYAQNLGADNLEYDWYGSMIHCLGSLMGSFGSIPCCFCCPNPYKEVQQGSVGLVTRFGKFYKSVDPGLVKINPLSESVRHVDVMIQTQTVPRQTALTKDNVNIYVDSVVYWHCTNPFKASFGISDVRTALIERAQTTLRSVIGSRTLQQVVVERDEIAAEIETILESISEKWGIKVESILLKDVIFSDDLQESLSSAAQQKRLGEAKIIAARAEVDAAKLMREAADILSSPAAIQIRQLEAFQTMAKQAGSKVIFVPTNLQTMGTAAANQLAIDATVA